MAATTTTTTGKDCGPSLCLLSLLLVLIAFCCWYPTNAASLHYVDGMVSKGKLSIENDDQYYWDVPVIRLDDPSEEALGESLERATQSHGFFYVEGHGIAQEHLDLLLNATKAFFDWSVEEKREIGMSMKQDHSAYTFDLERHKRDCFDFVRQRPRKSREALQYSCDDGDTLICTTTGDSQNASSSWPQIHSIMLDYFDELTHIVDKILPLILKYVLKMALAEAGVDANTKEAIITHRSDNLKLNHYVNTKVDHVVHIDPNFATLLLTDHHEGLEFYKNGSWKRIPLRPGALFLNFGYFMEHLTHGHVQALRHFVSMPGKAQEDRYSAAFFVIPQWDATIAPLPHFQALSPSNDAGASSVENGNKEEESAFVTITKRAYPPVVVSECLLNWNGADNV